MELTLLTPRFAICRLEPTTPVPAWAWQGPLCSVTRTGDELSVVVVEEVVPAEVRQEGGWRALQVAGPMDLGIVGVLASLTAPLADAGISLFAVSTFDTDYLLVRERSLAQAVAALEAAGHHVAVPDEHRS